MTQNEETDRLLLERGVLFLPWVGEDFAQGFHERHLLVLGESHYDEWEGEKHVLGQDFTRECIKEVIARVNGSPFWKNLEQALLNERRKDGWAPSGGRALWGRLAFYNFVQSPVSGGPRFRPEWIAFESSRNAFRAVLERLRPERVLVCGKGLWERMEEITLEEDYLHDDVQAYRLANGTKVWCLATVHPSSGRYSWGRLHSLIIAFLDEPQRAVELLRKPCRPCENSNGRGRRARIDSAFQSSSQAHVAGGVYWIQMMLIAVTARSFHTVCLRYAPDLPFRVLSHRLVSKARLRRVRFARLTA